MSAKTKLIFDGEDRTARAFRSVNAGLGRVNTQLRSLGIAAAAAVGTLSAVFIKTARDVDRVAKAAQAASIGVEQFQKWEAAAALAGVSTEQFGAAMGRANRRIGEFRNRGAGPAKDALNQFKIAMDDANGSARSNESIIREFIDNLQGVETAAERTALQTQLFGDDARLMTGFVDQGNAALDTFGDKLERAGGIISADTARQFESFNDQMAVLQRIVASQIAENIVGVGNAILQIANAAIRAIPHIRQFVDLITADRKIQLNIQLGLISQKLEKLNEDLRGARDTNIIEDIFGDPEEIKREQDALVGRIKATAAGLIEERKRVQAELDSLIANDRVINEQDILELLEFTKAGRVAGGQFVEGFDSSTRDQMAKVKADLDELFEFRDLDLFGFTTRRESVTPLEDAIARSIVRGADRGGVGLVDSLLSILRDNFVENFARMIAGAVGRGIGNFGGASGGGGFLGFLGGLLSFDTGGTVPGPTGAPRLAMVHGGETVLPVGASGGSVVINQTIDARGASDPALVVAAMQRTKSETIAAVADLVRRRKIG